ncbi:hypothetical protein VPH35_127554 [Triticum aestivum]
MVVRELWEMEELVGKILLSIPPEEPEILVRASLACKPWCRLLSGNAFRSRYLALHGTAPVLGFLQSWVAGELERFVPTKKFCPRSPIPKRFVSDNCFLGRPSLLIVKQLYFLLDHGLGILQYDLSRHRLSVIDLPEKLVEHNPFLISGPGGRLGVVHQDQHGLCVVCSRWSIDGEYRWPYLRASDLKMLRPIGHPLVLAGSLEGTDMSIVVTDLGVFTFDRKSLKFKKLLSKN